MERKTISHFVAGAIIAAIYIALFVFYYYKGLSFRQDFWIWFPPYLTCFVCIIIAVVLYGNSQNHRVSFGSLFNYGFKTTGIFVLLITAFMFVFLYFSDYKTRLITEMTRRIESDPALTNQKKDLALNLRSGLTTLVIGGAIFTNVIVGALGSLLSASFVRKDGPSSPHK